MWIIKLKFLYLSTLLFSMFLPSQNIHAQTLDCISEASQCFQINPLVLKAIIWNESGNNPQAINKNKNKTIDVGLMQINSIHFSQLQRMGVSLNSLTTNRCANVFSGAWLLNRVVKRYGYTWDGIASYHSRTPVLRENYANRLVSVIRDKFHTINNITIPYLPGIREKFQCQY